MWFWLQKETQLSLLEGLWSMRVLASFGQEGIGVAKQSSQQESALPARS